MLSNTAIRSLGVGTLRSPLHHGGPQGVRFRRDSERVLYDDTLAGLHATQDAGTKPVTFEVAGPRERIFFDPAKTTAGIVTCGGLCPGLNDVLRGIVLELYRRYQVTKIYGFRYGYQGLIPRYGYTPIILRPEALAGVHAFGGSILGTSRGKQNTADMVDVLEEMNIDILFVIGGDGTLRGAAEICDEIERRGLKKSVVGIPKTIDNDIQFLDKSFGFETAFAEAVKAIDSAYVESVGSPNGIGLVKLMGRDSGFITSFATLAGQSVNFALIPEVPFALDGARGLLEALRYHLANHKQAVIVVAEGAGQDLLARDPTATDASGNARYGDIGQYLKERITGVFQGTAHRDQPQVHRPELPHPQRARRAAGQRVLHAPGAKRRPRRHGRENEHARGPLALHVRPPAAGTGHARAAQGRSARRTVAFRVGEHRPAGAALLTRG